MVESCPDKLATSADRCGRRGPDTVALPGPAVLPSTPGEGGYTRLQLGPGEPHRVRTDLGGATPTGRFRGLAAFVQVSDLHVTDAQSPGRAEYLDRLGDEDSDVVDLVGPVGTYRAQESLTHHVVEAMTAHLRRIDTGPVTGTPVTFAVSTGDAADNAQGNEVGAALGLLDGGVEVRPDSGDPCRWEGVGSAEAYDVRYWHPDGTPHGQADDRPRARHGFPTVPGLLDAARRPFRSGGLGVPWHPVQGNHDRLLAGTVPADAALRRVATGGRKATGWPPGATGAGLHALLGDSRAQPPKLLRTLLGAPWRPVAPDARRRPLDTPGWLGLHDGRSARPVGAPTWYGFDAGPVRGLVLDTVNPEGGWQGSIGSDQLAWLEAELQGGSSRWLDADGHEQHQHADDRLFVLFSHHPLHCLTNAWSPLGHRRATRSEVGALVGRFPNVVAWVNGHTHAHTVTAHPGPGGGWWEITTASHVDWPQQARIVELAEDLDGGGIVLACTVVDHDGLVDPRTGTLGEVATLAGWSRELAANDWQPGSGHGRGGPVDRNVLLVHPARVGVAAGART